MIQRVNPHIAPPSGLLIDHLNLLVDLDRSLPVLDLACGRGRNGLLLAKHGVSVVFADRSASVLEVVGTHLSDADLSGRIWQVDLEKPGTEPLAKVSFGAIMGFCYLHRPLFPALKRAVMPGGLVIYETFTVDQGRLGRPNNPDYLLQPGELRETFQAWEIIHSFEGLRPNPERYVAQIVTRRPRP